MKFTEKGRVRIDISRLPLGGGAGGVRLLFSVSDTGIGISSEAMGRIFLSFTQEDGSIARKYGGAGLGLSIVSRLARMMGGSLCVDSEPGAGSTFYLSLRLGLPDEDGQSASAPIPPPAKNAPLGPRILVVEDDPVNRLAALRILEKLGYAVLGAADGAQALALLEIERFDLILMDVQMPGMNGLEATRRIRESGKTYAGMPIVAMTAHAMSGDRERFLTGGMDAYVSKPVDMKALADVLRGIFEKRANKEAGYPRNSRST